MGDVGRHFENPCWYQTDNLADFALMEVPMKSTRLFALVFALVVGTSSASAQGELPQIPASVAYMYVFLQRPDSTDRGSGREIATMISPDEL